MRRNVASHSGVRIVAPGAADTSGLLEDLERIDAGALERDTHAHAGEPGSENRNSRCDWAQESLARTTAPMRSIAERASGSTCASVCQTWIMSIQRSASTCTPAASALRASASE